MKDKAYNYLKKDRLHHIDMLESMDRNIADVIYADDDGVLIYNTTGCSYMISTQCSELLEKMCDMINEPLLITTHQPQFVPRLQERFVFNDRMDCFQCAYLSDQALDEQITQGIELRELTMSELDFVLMNYKHIPEEEYIIDRINAGMIGAFCDNEPVGFIGAHSEGSMGMLQMLPDYRRRGIAYSLEAALINRMKSHGQIPYGQIVTTNDASVRLQKKLGMSFSSNTITWLYV